MIRSRITQVAGALLIVLGIWLVQSDRTESPTPTVEIDLDQALVIETPTFGCAESAARERGQPAVKPDVAEDDRPSSAVLKLLTRHRRERRSAPSC